MRRLLPLLLLPSCAPALLSPQARTIHGVRVTYQQTTDLPPGKVASAQRLGDRCLIRVHPEHANAFILAHELAHCLDQGHSKTFGHAGCVWRSYACDPAEGYADTYARLTYDRYGLRRDILGWPAESPTTDLPPHPDEVTPEVIRQLQ